MWGGPCGRPGFHKRRPLCGPAGGHKGRPYEFEGLRSLQLIEACSSVFSRVTANPSGRIEAYRMGR